MGGKDAMEFDGPSGQPRTTVLVAMLVRGDLVCDRPRSSQPAHLAKHQSWGISELGGLA